jgi:hypothetical protein
MLRAKEIQNGTYAENLKKRTRRRLFGFAAGAGLGIIGSTFLGMSSWKTALAGGVVGLLVSGVKK